MKKAKAYKGGALKAQAIVKQAPASFDLIQSIGNAVRGALGGLAEFVSGELSPPELATTFATIKQTEDALKDIHDSVRERILKLALSGKPVTEKGGYRVEAGDLTIAVNPRNTGYDAKKLEALLREKGHDPAAWMATVVTYAIDEARLPRAIEAGVITVDELELCRPAASYNVMRPTKRSGA